MHDRWIWTKGGGLPEGGGVAGCRGKAETTIIL